MFGREGGGGKEHAQACEGASFDLQDIVFSFVELVKSIPKLQSDPGRKTYLRKAACKFCRNLNFLRLSD